MSQEQYEHAIELIDAANREDANIETADGKEWPKELLYGHRMADMQQRYAPDTGEAMKLALRGQHIERWKSPRDAYPMDKKGYHQWRRELYTFHAERVGELMAEAGYGEDDIDRAKQAVSKKSLKTNTDTQLLEDVAALVFIEHYMLDFANKHPEYDEAKWISIIQKTWRKMTDKAHNFALEGKIQLPEPLVPLIQKALAD